jgi:hypothetical protein
MDQVKKGIELRNQGKFSAAEKIFLRAVEEAGLVHGKTSEAYAVTLKSLAILRFEEQRWVEAAKLFQQCNEIFKRCVSLQFLAVTYCRWGTNGSGCETCPRIEQ